MKPGQLNPNNLQTPEDNARVRSQIKYLRDTLKVTQTELRTYLGGPSSQVSSWYSRGVNPSKKYAAKLQSAIEHFEAIKSYQI